MGQIQPISHEGLLRPSFNQARFLAGCEWDQANGRTPPPFHILDAISIVGELQSGALEEAINRVIDRHVGFRASFVPNLMELERHTLLERNPILGYPPSDLYMQRVAREAHVPLRKERGYGSPQEIAKLLQREAFRPFDFSQAPLIRATLLTVAPQEYLLVLVVHHVISDIFSERILRREIQVFYEDVVRGAPTGLPDLDVHYPDFAAWQHDTLPSSPSLEHWKDAWPRAQQGQLSYRDFPFSLPQSTGSPAVPAYEEVQLEQRNVAYLRTAACSKGFALSSVFLAAFGIVLHRWTRRPVVSVWNNFTNRGHPEVLNSLGWFVNSHLVPLDFSGDPTLAEILARLLVELSDVARHQEIPPALIYRNLSKPAKFTDLRIQFHFAEEEPFRPTGPPSMTRLPLADLIRFRFPAGLEFLVIDQRTSLALMAGYFQARFPQLAVRTLLQGAARIALMLLREPETKLSTISVTA